MSEPLSEKDLDAAMHLTGMNCEKATFVTAIQTLIASHRALKRELQSLIDVNNHNAFRLFGMSIEEARTLKQERDELKRQVEELQSIISGYHDETMRRVRRANEQEAP
jgi:hypothetical protein